MAKTSKPEGDMKPNNSLLVEQTTNETGAQALARKLLEPQFRHALSASTYAGKALGSNIESPGIMDFADHLQKVVERAEAGDLTVASRLLVSQAITLDAMFTELARRAAINMVEYLDASERYGRLALKAQANSRATLEALAKLHQPREQTVRHIHVNEGAQAVIADQFHNYTGGKQNGKSGDQPHAQGPCGPTVSGSDPLRDAVSIPGREWEPAVQNARRQGKRRTQR